jgi:predicted transposase YdaD
VLARLGDQREALRRILLRIGEREPGARDAALSELLTLAGLRKLGEVLEKEIRRMPILDDIMDHEVIGRERRRGREMGREEGREEGRREMILSLMGKRFGPVPDWAKNRIDGLSAADLERIGLRLLDALSLKDLLD